jgi:hypothetical protein
MMWVLELARKKRSVMPKNKNLKNLVRSRAAKTGESYTTARANIVKPKGEAEGCENPEVKCNILDQFDLTKTLVKFDVYPKIYINHKAVQITPSKVQVTIKPAPHEPFSSHGYIADRSVQVLFTERGYNSSSRQLEVPGVSIPPGKTAILTIEVGDNFRLVDSAMHLLGSTQRPATPVLDRLRSEWGYVGTPEYIRAVTKLERSKFWVTQKDLPDPFVSCLEESNPEGLTSQEVRKLLSDSSTCDVEILGNIWSTPDKTYEDRLKALDEVRRLNHSSIKKDRERYLTPTPKPLGESKAE